MRNVYTNGLAVPYLTTYRGSMCGHQWVDGSSVTYPDAVSNNIVVLLRNANATGALVIMGRTPTIHDDIAFDWWCRTDGLGTFDVADRQVAHGEGKAHLVNGHIEIVAGEFRLRWFESCSRYGKLGPRYWPSPKKIPEAIGVCVTTNQSVFGLDAMATNWVYETLCGTKIGSQ